MTKNKYIIIGLLVTIISVYFFTFNMKPSTLIENNLLPFTKDGFIDSELLSDTNKLIVSNTNYELYLDETTSYFKVIDKITGDVWESNPSINDPWENDPNVTITNSAIDKQKSTLELSYFNNSGSLATINNYKYSIYHPQNILDSAGKRTFEIKYTPNGFQVLYLIEDLEIDYLYFPKYLPKDVLEAMDERDVLEAIAYTGFDEELQAYEITQYEDMSRLVKKRLFKIFYEDMEYTREQSISENASYGYTEQYEKVYFEIGVDITLNIDGIDASIINESIVEPGNVKIASIAFLPLFGTAVSIVDDIETEGYIVLPDGSGAVIEFNNGKYYQEPYSKRVYGEDIALMSYKMAEQQQKISIPLFGMVKETSAFAAIITKGDTMATIKADVSGRIDSYNRVYASFKLRESESITLGSGYSQYGLDLFTQKIVNTDFTIRYIFLDNDNNNYVGIAHAYQNYLIDNEEFNSVDSTTSTILTTEFLGAYEQKGFFLGIPYYSDNSLTTFDESTIILDELSSRDINNINVLYTGIINGGLSNTLSDKFKIEKVLGGKRDYRNLLTYLEEKDIAFYPNVRLMTTSNYDKLFDNFRYTASRINGAQSYYFNYHLPSKLPASEVSFTNLKDDFIVNPLYLKPIIDKLYKDYDGENIAFDMLGSVIGGSYDRDDVLYKQDALQLQKNILLNTNKSVMLSDPLGFAIPYASYITDLPIETTLYAILDYQIPLLQLVLSGKIDYSTESLNMSNERSVQYNFLKVIETGSNIKYTLSYDDSKELRNTPFNYYLSTSYTNWLDSIEDMVNELDNIGIHKGSLIDHIKLENNVYQVTYSTGLKIIINYNLSDVTIGTTDVGAMDYIVLEVG